MKYLGNLVALFFGIVVLTGCSDPEGSLIIFDNGNPKADIVVANEATETERYAAQELAKFLKEISGGGFEINNLPAKTKYHILIGQDAARNADINFTTNGLNADGVTLQRKGNNLIIAGGRPRGTIYAIYTFLEDYMGCRWWSKDASYIPTKKTLKIDTLNYSYVPQLDYRHTSWYGSMEPGFSTRNKLNGSPKLKPLKYGGHTTHGGVHTFFSFIPPFRYFQNHPEWFALIDGKRSPWRSQLCLTNEEMKELLIIHLKSKIINHPNQKVFSVSQEDWFGNCECESCKKLDDEAGSPAGSLIHFINDVAEEIEKEFPHVYISTLAYMYSRKPPKNIKPRKNVIIQLCNIECDFSVPLTDDRNKDFRDDILGWSEIADNLYVWDYTTNFHHFYTFHPNLRILGPNIRFFTNHKAKGIYEQGGYLSPWPEFAELRAWMIAKLLWNPDLDDRKLMREFCEGYYGNAGEHILNYINIIHDGIAITKDTVTRKSWPDYRFITFDLMDNLLSELSLAEKSVGEDAGLLARIERIKMNVTYTFIFNWKRLKKGCNEANLDWPMEDDIEVVADDFITWAKANEITNIFEWHTGFRRIEAEVKKIKGE